tara:strand:- start:215 stop:394 length:180 start_codon:yes stop_codon:yes gene_type:complete
MVGHKFKIRGVTVELRVNKNISYHDVYSISIWTVSGVPNKLLLNKILTYLELEGFINGK